MFVEYYQNRKELDRAFKVAEGVSASGTKPEYTRADRPMNFNTVPSSSFVYDILKTMEMSKGSFKDPAQYDAAVQSVVDLALDAMPERSFMQGFRRRKDVRGYIGDMTPTKVGDTEFDAVSMMKEKGRDLNRQIVQMQASAEIEKFRNQLKEGGYLNNPETADIARKLDQIAAFAQKPNVPRWSQVANGVGFNMTMGLNFSSAAITFFDVAMSAMPIISAEYGVGNTASAYGTATRLLANSPTTRGVMVSGPDGQPVEQEVNMGMAGKSIFNLSADKLPPEMRDARLDVLIEMGSDQGQANQSMTQESLEIGRDAPLEGVNKWSSAMFHHSERFNRETTLTAAYLLEVQKLKKQGRDLSEQDYRDAAQKAIETTEFTLGSTAAAGRPVWAQSGVGNVLFLFKRFAIAKYYMMYKLGHESIGTTNVERIMQEMGVTEAEAQQTANDRKIARVGLRNFLITTGVMAGAGGMPMMGAFGVIYNMFADDDEDDFEAALRKFTGEGIYGGLANQVLGVDVANRISLNSLLYRPPLIDKDQSPIWTFAEQMGGPVVGISISGLRGAGEVWSGFKDGDMQAVIRGAETVVPSAIRNISKGVRFYTEGANTRRGDPITEDINAYNSIMQGLGFAPQAYIQQLEFNKNARRREEACAGRRRARARSAHEGGAQAQGAQRHGGGDAPGVHGERNERVCEAHALALHRVRARPHGVQLGQVLHSQATVSVRRARVGAQQRLPSTDLKDVGRARAYGHKRTMHLRGRLRRERQVRRERERRAGRKSATAPCGFLLRRLWEVRLDALHRRALVGVALEAGHEQRADFRRPIYRNVKGFLVVCHLVHNPQRLHSVPRRLARVDLPDRDSEAVDVRLECSSRRVHLALKHLGSGPRRRTEHPHCRGCRNTVVFSGEAKVGDLARALAQQDVKALEVAVRDLARVQIRHPRGDLRHHLQPLGVRQGTPALRPEHVP